MTHGALQRLSDRQPIAERDGNPTFDFQRTWQEIVEHLEQMEEGLDDKQPLDATLTALAAYSTNGILTQTAADTFTGRTITGTANEITVTNGIGVAGNPTLSLPTALTFTGKTVTGGTFTGITDIAVADGGTGASTAADARTNLGAAPLASPTFTGTATAPVLRLTDTTDASLSSTGHAFQIGSSSGTNIAADNNEIMARNNGAASTLFLNPDGGQVWIGAGGLAVAGDQVVSARGAAVADASGGATIDTQARTAINTLLARLRVHGLIAT